MLFGRSNVTQVDTLNDADIGHWRCPPTLLVVIRAVLNLETLC
jgi:hypothetical protein